MRRILNALLYLLVSGVQWRLLPHHFPRWSLVYYHFRRFHRLDVWRRLSHLLRVMVRHKAGRRTHASAGCLDSQSVKSISVPGERGFDSHKRVKGRKRHVLCDTLGLPLEILVTPANISDSKGAQKLLQRAGRRRGPLKALRHLWADAGYKQGFIDWCQKRGLRVEIVTAEPGQKGFAVQKRRWVSERTFSWLCSNRRLALNYEVLAPLSESLAWLASIRLYIRRLA
jgi:putative transposase